MKNQYCIKTLTISFLIFCALAIVAIKAVNPTKNNVALALTSGHNRAFGKANLITERITPEDTSIWNSAIKAVDQFVKSVKDEQLNKKMAQLQRISNELLNTLKSSYGQYIAPLLSSPEKPKGTADFKKIDPTRLQMSQINLLIKPLLLHKDVATRILKELRQMAHTKLPKKLHSQAKKEAQAILIHLATALEVTLEKIANDVAKLDAFAYISGKK